MLPFVLLAAAAALAENVGAPPPAEQRPACKSEIAGMMWPLEANESPRLMHKLARDGSLWICTWGRWKYHWRQPVVPVRALQQASQVKPKPLSETPATEP